MLKKFLSLLSAISILLINSMPAYCHTQESRIEHLDVHKCAPCNEVIVNCKQRTVKEMLGDKAESADVETEVVSQKPEEKLESLKNMLDKNLITQEEYEKLKVKLGLKEQDLKHTNIFERKFLFW